MVLKMREMMKRRDNQKGFTLVELIVVMAILAVLAGIAVPKFSGVLNESKVKADGATATSIAKAARIQEINTSATTAVTYDTLDPDYFDKTATPTSGGAFVLSQGLTDPYVVKWTPDKAGDHNVEQILTEGQSFEMK